MLPALGTRNERVLVTADLTLGGSGRVSQPSSAQPRTGPFRSPARSPASRCGESRTDAKGFEACSPPLLEPGVMDVITQHVNAARAGRVGWIWGGKAPDASVAVEAAIPADRVQEHQGEIA